MAQQPICCKIFDRIYLGNLAFVRNKKCVATMEDEYGITAVINVSHHLGHTGALAFDLPMIDDRVSYSAFQEWSFRVVRLLQKLTQECDHKVLVHCVEGINRSCAALAAYQILVLGKDASEAIASVRLGKYGVRDWPTLTNVAFVQHLQMMDNDMTRAAFIKN